VIRILESVLDASELEAIRDALARAHFIPGRATAKGVAAEVKHNLQATPSAYIGDAEVIVLGALQRSQEIQSIALPRQVSAPVFSRYETGMSYGRHCDSPRVGGLRADLSVTVFLSDPSDYDGGELVIEDEGVVRLVRPRAGAAVVYSSGLIHRVSEVVRGVRLAAVLWVQSHVGGERDREILRSLSEIAGRVPGEDALRLAQIRGELYRRWSG
jgi:PKHD-type hydroxylase